MAAPSNLILLTSALYPGNPKVDTLTDDFATADGAKWSYLGTAAVSGGQLVLTPTSIYSDQIRSVAAYDLTGSSRTAELVQRPNVGNGGVETFIVAQTSTTDSQDSVYWDVVGANLVAMRTVGGAFTQVAAVTYDATAHRRLRLREAAGTVFWDTSPDGSTWTNRATWVATFATTTMYVRVGSGYGGTEPAPGTAIWDNVNVAPVEVHTTSGTATATAAAAAATATTRAKTATATATATATRTGSSTRTGTGTAAAAATATATTSSTRTATGTALATATATATTSSQRTTARTATAIAGASSSTATVRSKAGTATLLAGADALTTTWRSDTGTATAYATASGITGQGSGYRDITLTVGLGSSRSLTASGSSRGLTAIGTGARSLTAAGASRQLVAAGSSRTLTARPRE